jgi:subtilisin family serine protease
MKSALRASLGILTAVTLSLPACSGGGGNSVPSAPSTSAQSAFVCPSSDGTSSVATGGSTAQSTARRAPVPVASAATSNGRIAVTYDRTAYDRAASAYALREQSAGATLVHSFDYATLGKVVRVFAVPPSQETAAMAALRNQTGVLGVAPTGQRRYALTASPNLVNNHYFDGFPPANTPPYYENSTIPGQWDMHAISLEHAFGYATSSNSTGSAQSGALGTHNIKLAVIDTGEDTLHPDLAGNVVYQKCFITSTSGVQSIGAFSTDPDGHGTDVAGIAAAVTNSASGLGFAGAGGNTAIMAYRVFPTPDDNCTNASSSDPQCGADTTDIASAIDDAVQNGASVITISLGGGSCANGVDSDPVEGAAVANAIAHNVIVVAASGNESGSTVDAPGCDTGVIAVGASALDDGQPNGSGHAGGTPVSPVEYVASYSNHGSPASSAGCSGSACLSAWGIVAPGGDPAPNSDNDDLHWIENIWTSTPFDGNFAGTCTPDFGTTSVADCRTLIAGTSQATPHVAGVAALVCALNASDCNPSSMKQLLCETAHDIGDPNEGCGRLDAYLAVATAVNDPNPPKR